MATGYAAAIARDGYAIVPGVLGSDVLAALTEALERPTPEGDTPACRTRNGVVYAVRSLLERSPEVRRVADSAQVRSLVEPILGPGAFPVRGLLFDKTPGANWAVPWHRDRTIAVRERVDAPGFGPWTLKAGVTHVQPPLSVLQRMLAVRLHLDPCPATNGPLRVIPGSHDDEPPDPETETVANRREGVTCSADAGDALVMRPLILHASPASAEPRRRRVVHLEFAADPLPGGLEWFEAEGPN